MPEVCKLKFHHKKQITSAKSLDTHHSISDCMAPNMAANWNRLLKSPASLTCHQSSIFYWAQRAISEFELIGCPVFWDCTVSVWWQQWIDTMDSTWAETCTRSRHFHDRAAERKRQRESEWNEESGWHWTREKIVFTVIPGCSNSTSFRSTRLNRLLL